MTDLRDQLQTALGSAYTIERELGGGGMSRVLVARDTALRRDVVIKVLPPELVAGVNVERFRREILVAAGLQHPHIVPVLASGEMHGLPWFTMPFVQGESLRDRVSRGPLPIGEVVSTLREIAKALAYAHERGVVHRDIKPDNVLITGGTAVVTDFGIAKALSASRTAGDAHATRGSLTQVGTSIGTPTYMAPEQAAADPDTDARADLYSFGCVAYEMLAGRPPFVGMSPQKLLAAHMGERPQDITALRRDTPPLLGELVMRCLEKEPNNRPSSAADVVRALEMVSTTSGNTTAASAVLLGGRVRMRVALAAWAGVFVASWILAKAAIVGIGLPSWVLPGALIVAALGLPAILFTAYVQKTAHAALTRTPTLTPGGTPSPNSTMATIAMRASPHLSWRRTVRGGAMAFGVFVAIVIAFMGLRAMGIGPAGSLLAAGRIKAKEPVLVADFAVTKGDSTLGTVVSEAIRASLSQSKAVTLMSAARVAGALQRMQKPANSRLDLTLARQVAQREGVKAIIDGDVAALGAGYAISIRLVTADSGTVLARAQQIAGSPTDLIAAADKAGRDLRERMGESLRSVQNAPPLDQVTTPSIEALRLYSEGAHAYDANSDIQTAVNRLTAAVAIDSGFAMAWRKLAAVYNSSGAYPLSVVDSVLTKAYLHRDRLTTREREITEASYFYFGPGHDRVRAGAAYERLLASGDSDLALNNYGLVQNSRRRYAAAESLFRAASKLGGSAAPALANIIVTLMESHNGARAEQLIDSVLKTNDSPQFRGGMLLLRASNLEIRGDIRTTMALIDSLIAHGDPITRGQAMLIDIGLSNLRGRPAEAASKTLAFNTYAGTLGLPPSLLQEALTLALTEVALDRSALAVARVDAALAAKPLRSLAESDRDYLGVAQVYALAGRADKAKAILAQRGAELHDTARIRSELPIATRVNGQIMVAEGHPNDAIRQFWQGDSLPDGPFDECDLCTLANLGRAYDKASAPDSAIKYYEAALASGFYARVNSDMFRAPMERRVGELYEAKGDRAKAVHHYQAFVDFWKDAEPDLQPQVADVRKRLARLSDTERR